MVQCDKEVSFRNYSDVSNWQDNQLPKGPNLEIPCEWRMYLDSDLPILETLTIYGELKFVNDPSRPV